MKELKLMSHLVIVNIDIFVAFRNCIIKFWLLQKIPYMCDVQ